MTAPRRSGKKPPGKTGATAAVADVPGTPDLSSPGLFLNRELTWLEFNRRVLHEAEDFRWVTFETHEVTRFADALKALATTRFDAVLLDLSLPDMDGWSLLDLLKRDPHTRQIPVHVIKGRRDDRQQATLDRCRDLRRS